MTTIRKNYLLAVLLSILATNYVDRQALGLVLQDIKVELSLSDTQLGLLTGIAFALFYSLMGIPIARWADRGNRITIISITTALWSVALALCGLAGNFAQLLLIRTGVAVGEAGCIPPAHSIIADYFARPERPRAVAIYMLGGSLSVVIGYFLAGWLNEDYGWRITFMILSVPGLLLAMLSWLTLRDPRRARTERSSASAPYSATPAGRSDPSIQEVCVALWQNVTFRHLLLCFSVVCFFGYGIAQWQPAFFIRSYGLRTGELGTWLMVIYGVGGMLGTYLGGELAIRLAPNNERLQLKAMTFAYAAFAVLSVFIYMAQNQYVAFTLMGIAAIGGGTASGPLFATIQTLVPERMRAMSIAMVYLFANLIGMGLGPLAAGALSDALHAALGQESLRYALLAMCPGYFWGAWHLWRASRTVGQDLEKAQQTSAVSFRGDSNLINSRMESSRA